MTDRLANSTPASVFSFTVAAPAGPQAISVTVTGGSNRSGNIWAAESPATSQEPYLRGPLTTIWTPVFAGTTSYAVISVVSPRPSVVRDAFNFAEILLG